MSAVLVYCKWTLNQDDDDDDDLHAMKRRPGVGTNETKPKQH